MGQFSAGDRGYGVVAESISATGSREERMRTVVDALWESLADKGVSWVGFYVEQPGATDDSRLVLGPCRDKPACSPIGLHGVCGQSFRFRQPRIVDDVTALGADYIACDADDRSEITLPLLDAEDRCWAVLDLDSKEHGAFDESDAQGLRLILDAAGL